VGSETEERVLIELKSPSDDIFDMKEVKTINDVKKEYSLSASLSRAIPQILEYKKILEDKRQEIRNLKKLVNLKR